MTMESYLSALFFCTFFKHISFTYATTAFSERYATKSITTEIKQTGRTRQERLLISVLWHG